MSLGLRHQTQFALFHCIRSDCQETELHTTGHAAGGGAIHHLVEIKVVLAVAVFLRGIDIRKDHLGNTLHDGCGIYVGILDFTGDVLFLIGQEVISITGPPNIVLAHQTVQ